jgi:hypothetical protein
MKKPKFTKIKLSRTAMQALCGAAMGVRPDEVQVFDEVTEVKVSRTA